jgi:hypothetical protein
MKGSFAVYIRVSEEGAINVISEEELLLKAPLDLVDTIHTFYAALVSLKANACSFAASPQRTWHCA